MHTVDTIILAGGRGTRLSGLVRDMPKPLAPVNGRPFLDIILSQLNGVQAVRRVVMAVGYKGEQIITRYQGCTAYRFSILFSSEREPLGTGGAIKKALASTDSDCVLIMNGDSYADADIDGLVLSHRTRRARLTVVLKEMDNAGRYGRVTVDGRSRILTFEEKRPEPVRGLINTGIYLAERTLFDHVDDARALSFENELLPDMIQDSAYGFIISGRFIDIGVPEAYTTADSFFHEES